MHIRWMIFGCLVYAGTIDGKVRNDCIGTRGRGRGGHQQLPQFHSQLFVRQDPAEVLLLTQTRMRGSSTHFDTSYASPGHLCLRGKCCWVWTAPSPLLLCISRLVRLFRLGDYCQVLNASGKWLLL